MSQTLPNAVPQKIRENKWFLFSKNDIFEKQKNFSETGRKKKSKRGVVYSTAIYNLPPLPRHRIIVETSLEKQFVVDEEAIRLQLAVPVIHNTCD